MALTVSLVDVRTEIFDRIALKNSDVIEIPEANRYINKSGTELNDLLAQAYGAKYIMKRATFSLVPNQELYAIATDCGAPDFMALQGLEIRDGAGDWRDLKEVKLGDRNRYQRPVYGGNFGNQYGYRFEGANLVIAPTPATASQCRILYTPTWTTLVEDLDTFDTIDGWDEYIVVDVCIKCLNKQDLPSGEFKEQKALMRKRIDDLKQMRNTAEAPLIRDVDADDYFVGMFRS